MQAPGTGKPLLGTGHARDHRNCPEPQIAVAARFVLPRESAAGYGQTGSEQKVGAVEIGDIDVLQRDHGLVRIVDYHVGA